ncbi:MAG: PHP domain-containing protein [Candidatus Bathyarchaeia archaeon]
MLMDYHIHTRASPDAKGEMQEYVKKAVEKHLSEIGFSDHVILHHIAGCPNIPYSKWQATNKNFSLQKKNRTFR